MISYKVEKLKNILHELKEGILDAHYEEIALNKDTIPLDPDYNKYLSLEDADTLFILTVRDKELIIGYFIGFITPHIHYNSTVFCFTDIYYIKPEYRKTLIGFNLFKEVEKELKLKNVNKWILPCKLHSGLDHSKLFEGIGFSQIEKVFAKTI